MMLNAKNYTLAILYLIGSFTVGCDRGASSSSNSLESDPLTVAFVTNNAAGFWATAAAGCAQAEKDFGVTCEFRTADGTAAGQKRVVEELISMNVDGMAISPIDPANQVGLLNAVAARMPLICQDSDAPDSDRICYLGTDNVKAGREAGRMIIEALPEGGEVMIFVGQLDAQNAVERTEGIKRQLADHPTIKILGIQTDGVDPVECKAKVQETLSAYPGVDCLVGLWAYNPPAILSAVKDAGRAGQIKIVAFDEEDDTLQGITDGHIHGTVVQQPYEFGYQAVKVLTALAREQDAGIPENGIVEIPVRVIKKHNVDSFWVELKDLQGRS